MFYVNLKCFMSGITFHPTCSASSIINAPLSWIQVDNMPLIGRNQAYVHTAIIIGENFINNKCIRLKDISLIIRKLCLWRQKRKKKI